MSLRTHDIRLTGRAVHLRPMTEDDWDVLFKWNNDPQVLYGAEGDDISGYDPESLKQMYDMVSQTAFCFIIEVEAQPVGECWLQTMNLARILQQHPGQDCRRIDLMIGERDQWGKGHGTDVIRTLTRFAFEQAKADRVFGCDIAHDNHASRRAFEKAGYRIVAKIAQPAGQKSEFRCDMGVARADWYALGRADHDSAGHNHHS